MVAIILNLIIPHDLVDTEELAVEQAWDEDEDEGLLEDKTEDTPAKEFDEEDVPDKEESAPMEELVKPEEEIEA